MKKIRESRAKEVFCKLIDTRTGKVITKKSQMPIWNISLFNRAFGLNSSDFRWIRL